MPTKILVVDDSPVERCLVEGLLSQNPNYCVTLAENGKVALRQIDPVDQVGQAAQPRDPRTLAGCGKLRRPAQRRQYPCIMVRHPTAPLS